MMIRVFIIEDHDVMRDTLGDYLLLSPDLELCGTAEDADTATHDLAAADPDVVVLDLSLPDRSGIELLREIRDRWGTPCVVLTGHGERAYVAQAFAAGARGYVLKGNPADVPVAIRRVAGGHLHLSDVLRRRLDYEPDGSGS